MSTQSYHVLGRIELARRSLTIGLGALLIERGMRHAASVGAAIVWARARDSALYFYERRGFEVRGEGFIDGPTAMPHHIVVRTV